MMRRVLLVTRHTSSRRIPHDALQGMGWNLTGEAMTAGQIPQAAQTGYGYTGLREDRLLLAIAY